MIPSSAPIGTKKKELLNERIFLLWSCLLGGALRIENEYAEIAQTMRDASHELVRLLDPLPCHWCGRACPKMRRYLVPEGVRCITCEAHRRRYGTLNPEPTHRKRTKTTFRRNGSVRWWSVCEQCWRISSSVATIPISELAAMSKEERDWLQRAIQQRKEAGLS